MIVWKRNNNNEWYNDQIVVQSILLVLMRGTNLICHIELELISIGFSILSGMAGTYSTPKAPKKGNQHQFLLDNKTFIKLYPTVVIGVNLFLLYGMLLALGLDCFRNGKKYETIH
ncbi:hypothetical protein BLOT_004788 [Blomia tropicalis]|nr:hypothetical protein BLOT_004788 [Blomia tropicalis]